QFVFTSNGGIQFKKYSQKNDQGGVDGNSDALIIPVPPDPEGSQDYSNDSWYLDERLGARSCRSFMKNVCTAVGIDIKDRDIVNHSGRSTPITSLFQKGVAIGTTMSITGHKSESSYRIYARSSNKQKEDALSLLISSVGALPCNSQDSEASIK
ncbi:12940_t:CDS:2, partial [Racocetra fulgida]